MGNNRIRYWDIAKGITIILVILGHTANLPPDWRPLIFSFHMPMFFVSNAFFIKKYDIKHALMRGSQTLLRPYAITCIISAFIAAYYNSDIATNIFILRDRLYDMFVGMSYTRGILENFKSVWLVWFVICLFLARMVYILVMQITQRLPPLLSLALCIGISLLGLHLGNAIGFLPWSADVSLFAILFMWVGDHSKYLLNRITHSKQLVTIAIIFTVISIPLWIYMVNGKGYWIEMSVRQYSGKYLCVISALLGITIIVMLSILCDRLLNRLSTILAWLGKESLIILIIHCLELRFFDWQTHIYSHLPCIIKGIWYREFLVKSVSIIFVSWLIVKLRNVIQNPDYIDNRIETSKLTTS